MICCQAGWSILGEMSQLNPGLTQGTKLSLPPKLYCREAFLQWVIRSALEHPAEEVLSHHSSAWHWGNCACEAPHLLPWPPQNFTLSPLLLPCSRSKRWDQPSAGKNHLIHFDRAVLRHRMQPCSCQSATSNNLAKENVVLCCSGFSKYTICHSIKRNYISD